MMLAVKDQCLSAAVTQTRLQLNLNHDATVPLTTSIENVVLREKLKCGGFFFSESKSVLQWNRDAAENLGILQVSVPFSTSDSGTSNDRLRVRKTSEGLKPLAGVCLFKTFGNYTSIVVSVVRLHWHNL
jgi:hypothetical protein